MQSRIQQLLMKYLILVVLRKEFTLVGMIFLSDCVELQWNYRRTAESGIEVVRYMSQLLAITEAASISSPSGD